MSICQVLTCITHPFVTKNISVNSIVRKEGLLLKAKSVILMIVIAVTIFSVSVMVNNTIVINDDVCETVSIAWGSKGEDVKRIQSKLKQWDYYDGPIDGVFEAKTFEAVKLFQRRNGLLVDGVVGSQTAAALGITLTDTEGGRGKADAAYVSTSGVTNRNDINLLARAIHGEARGEPYIGKVAIAAVILNRVRHPSFPNTIAGVIYQPGAFTAVADGQINLEPDKESIRAAHDALNGWDPSGGAIYYYNPAKTTNRWIWSRPVYRVIGKHRFAK